MEHVFILYDARRGGDRGTGCVATLSVCRSMLPTNGNLAYILEQAVRLGGHHNMPPPRDLDFWLFDLEVGVGVACDLYPCAKFRLPRPFGFRVRADVRDIRQTDRRRRSPLNAPAPPPLRGGGIITEWQQYFQRHRRHGARAALLRQLSFLLNY